MKTAAITILGFLAISTGALAQTSTTVYGVLDLAVQSASTGGQRTTRLDSSSVAPSRFGFQGSEYLGGGTQAVYRLEGGINANNGTSANGGVLFGREVWAGLQGDYGRVQAGLNYTPVFLTYAAYSLGELNSLGWGNATNNFAFIPDCLVSNSILYTSPAFSGFKIRAEYAFGNNSAAGQPQKIGDTVSLATTYRNNAFSADLTYLQQTYVATSTITATTPTEVGKYYVFGASYDFGFVKPAFLYQSHNDSSDVTNAIRASFANPNNHFYEVNALVRAMPNGTFLVSFGQYEKKTSSAGDAKSYAIRYDYSLSKRTGLYAGAARVQNESASNFSVANAGGAGIATALGNSINSVIVGMITRF
jgi:predicted porin